MKMDWSGSGDKRAHRGNSIRQALGTRPAVSVIPGLNQFALMKLFNYLHVIVLHLSRRPNPLAELMKFMNFRCENDRALKLR
jgi:hypothetical protein